MQRRAARPRLLLSVAVALVALAAACGSSEGDEPIAAPSVSFFDAVDERLDVEGLDLKTVCPVEEPVAARVLADYGAMFVVTESVNVMTRCVFSNEAEVTDYHATLTTQSTTIEGKDVTLQVEAFAALEAARAEASGAGLSITPRGGFPAARDFATTVDLWRSRVEPALAFWTEEGKLTNGETAAIVNSPPADQVATVLSLEDRGLFFSTDFDRSILTSVAAPGSSQHLSLLAFDVVEHENPDVRAVLAEHGWFPTVEDDPPHFTFLGRDEADLPAHGLEQVTSGGRTYWVPSD